MTNTKRSLNDDIPPLVKNLMEGMVDLGLSVGEKLAFINLLNYTKDSPITQKFLERIDQKTDDDKLKKTEVGSKGKER